MEKFIFIDGKGIIPHGVTRIDEDFIDDSVRSRLVSLEIPDSLTEIGDGAFWDCTTLVSVRIPESVTEIGEQAFSGCRSLRSIEIPGNVTRIGPAAFENCSLLNTITVSPENQYFKSENNCCLTKDGKTLVFGCYKSIIPYGVETIGKWSFAHLSYLLSIEIPDSVTDIQEFAFNFSHLRSIIIPDSVKKLGHYAFGNCYFLKSIEIPYNIESDSAFLENHSLRQVILRTTEKEPSQFLLDILNDRGHLFWRYLMLKGTSPVPTISLKVPAGCEDDFRNHPMIRGRVKEVLTIS